MDITTTDLVDTKDPEIDSRGLALIEEFQEQVVQIPRVVVGEQAEDDINIPGKFTLHSKKMAMMWSKAWYDHRVFRCSPRDRSDRLIPSNPLCVPSLQIIVVPSPRTCNQKYREPMARHGPISQPGLSNPRHHVQQQWRHEDQLGELFQGANPDLVERVLLFNLRWWHG